MVQRHLRKISLLSLPAVGVGNKSPGATAAEKSTCSCQKEFEMLVLTRKVGESILVPTLGMTIQVGAVESGLVRLRIALPAETKVFGMGAVNDSGEAIEPPPVDQK